MTDRRPLEGVLALVLVASALLTVPEARAQQRFPQRALHLIVPFPPGGSTDIVARAIGQSMADGLGQAVIIDNRPGAGGSIGVEAAVRAPADGHTIVMGHIGTLAVNPALYAHLAYDPLRDLAPIDLIALVPNILVVHPSVPASTVHELVALLRARPGAYSYASGGAGSAAHLAVEYFKLVTGTDIVHVPYKGTGPAMTDLLGGQVALTMTGLPPLAPQIRAGKVRALAVAGSQRLAQMPQLPTVAEAGYPGFAATQWYGLLAPAGTPAAIIDRLHAEVVRVVALPAVRARLEAEGAEPVDSSPVRFGAFIRSEIERWGKVVREARIRVD
jgi:tripartite-type tricarboxylate transporter receptor subunit TctC